MKLYAGLAIAAAATAMVGAAMAADGGKFVQTGKAADALKDSNIINIQTAEAIGQACVEEARKQGVKISVVVMDKFHEPMYFYRMDGQGKANVDTAFMKANTALNVRAPSKTVMNGVLRGGSEARQIMFGNFANSGGLPIIINENQMIGAIGVGGSAPKVFDPNPWSDEICAWRALTKVIGPQPPLLPDIRPNATAAGGAGGRGAGAPNR